MKNMQLPNPVLANVIKRAALATLGGDLVGFFVGGWVLKLDSNLFFLAALLPWLPIVAVAYQRPESPTRFDRVVMFADCPVLFLGLYFYSKLYLMSSTIREANQAASVDAPIAILLVVLRHWRRATEQPRYAKKR